MEESQAEKETADFLLKKGWDVTLKVHDGGHYIPEWSINEVLDWFQSKRVFCQRLRGAGVFCIL
ncbi:MAG: hypothetical protein GX639_14425 [Fibrobacter sp.]|nr:hypothetical protein [Fibrobacter sp.]